MPIERSVVSLDEALEVCTTTKRIFEVGGFFGGLGPEVGGVHAAVRASRGVVRPTKDVCFLKEDAIPILLKS
jgi:hypothetical protein